jgi:hypothetical protein
MHETALSVIGGGERLTREYSRLSAFAALRLPGLACLPGSGTRTPQVSRSEEPIKQSALLFHSRVAPSPTALDLTTTTSMAPVRRSSRSAASSATASKCHSISLRRLVANVWPQLRKLPLENHPLVPLRAAIGLELTEPWQNLSRCLTLTKTKATS